MRINLIALRVIRFLDLSSFCYLESNTTFRKCICFLPQVKEWDGIYLLRFDSIRDSAQYSETFKLTILTEPFRFQLIWLIHPLSFPLYERQRGKFDGIWPTTAAFGQISSDLPT